MKAFILAVGATTLATLGFEVAQAEDLFHPAPNSRPAASFQGYIYGGKSPSAARDRLLVSGSTHLRLAPTNNAYAGEVIYQRIGGAEP